MLGTRPLRHVCTDVLEASVLKRELEPCLEVDLKAVQRPSIEIYHVKLHCWTLTIVWPLMVFLMRQGPCIRHPAPAACWYVCVGSLSAEGEAKTVT